MLVLSRKKDESITIEAADANGFPVVIDIMIIEIRGDKVRLGVNAPKSIPVHRREIYESIQREQKAAQS